MMLSRWQDMVMRQVTDREVIPYGPNGIRLFFTYHDLPTHTLSEFRRRMHQYKEWETDLNISSVSCGVWRETCILESSAGGGCRLQIFPSVGPFIAP